MISDMNTKPTYQELEKAQQTLKVKVDLQQKILNNFKDDIYISNHDYKIEYVNLALQKRLGRNPVNEICHKAIYNLEEKCDWCIYEKLNENKHRIEYELNTENGKIIEVTNILLTRSQKLTIYHDITQLKKNEQALKENEAKLRESNNTKDKFFSVIAHDLRSPFNSMLGFSELLNENFESFDTTQQKEFINIIHRGLQNTYKLLENLLIWSQMQQWHINFKPEKINLNVLSNEIIEQLSLSAESKSISINNSISDNVFVKADKNMLSTIIRNLMSNAIKFTHKEGRVSVNGKFITNENKQNLVEISIKDNGLGISKEMQSKLFLPEENTSTKGTENETGTGLGLLLCKGFVEKHGGKIWIESEVGCGSTFFITIPLSN
ncbi:MAG: hypothetical protein GQ564_18010 [Bacteroidales bacterium]|nr:hypothetical protein [Bacteroidales bacterium]